LPDGKQKRSDGKKSQVKLWKLKEKFINPTAEVLEQVKTDLGITPLGELNNYNRDIGQLLKGLASFTSQQTSLSAAQRKLDQKLKETKEKKQEIKQQIADITTAQGSLAFSRRAVNDIVNMRDTLDLDTKGVDNLLKSLELDPTINIKTKEGRKKFLEVIEEKLLPLMPKEFWIKDGIDIFTKSHNNYGYF
jgi:chromosome segregation ATPase